MLDKVVIIQLLRVTPHNDDIVPSALLASTP